MTQLSYQSFSIALERPMTPPLFFLRESSPARELFLPSLQF